MSFIQGFPDDYRQATDYGFPQSERNRVSERFPEVEIVHTLDGGITEVWARGKSGTLRALFRVEPGFEFKVYDTLVDWRYASNNSGKDSADKKAKEIYEANKLSRRRQEQNMIEGMDPDMVAHRAASRLGIRGLRGAPGVQVQVPQKHRT